MGDTAAANASRTGRRLRIRALDRPSGRCAGDWHASAARGPGPGSEGQPFLQTTITSPPYSTLVDYGSNSQIGWGQSYDDYLKDCRSVFDGVHQWSLDTGSMWIVADSLMERR